MKKFKVLFELTMDEEEFKGNFSNFESGSCDADVVASEIYSWLFEDGFEVEELSVIEE